MRRHGRDNHIGFVKRLREIGRDPQLQAEK